MLRTETFPSDRQPHIDDHRVLHRRYNTAIFADDYDSLQAAVDAGAAQGIPGVLLNPAGHYELTQTLTVPPEVYLDGGGRSITSYAPTPRIRAEIVTDAALDPMIQLGYFAGITGCLVNGNRVARGAVYCKDVGYNHITDNLIARCVDYGLKFGGSLFPTIKRNYIYGIEGIGLDALRPYGDTGYYGINVGLSERNEYGGGTRAAMRVEGILTSIADDFEGACNGEARVQVGAGNVASTLTMYAPYFELTSGNGPAYAIRIGNSSSLILRDGKAYGDVNDPDAIFLDGGLVDTLVVEGMEISRFATVFACALAWHSNLVIAGNRYADATTINAIRNYDVAQSRLCVWPGVHID